MADRGKVVLSWDAGSARKILSQMYQSMGVNRGPNESYGDYEPRNGESPEDWVRRLGENLSPEAFASFKKAYGSYAIDLPVDPNQSAVDEQNRQQALRDETDAKLADFLNSIKPGVFENDPMAARVRDYASNRAQESNALRGLGTSGIGMRNQNKTTADALANYDMQRQQNYVQGIAGLRQAREGSLGNAAQRNQFGQQLDLNIQQMNEQARAQAAQNSMSMGQGIGSVLGGIGGGIGGFFLGGPAGAAMGAGLGSRFGGGIGGLASGGGYQPGTYRRSGGYSFRGGGIGGY